MIRLTSCALLMCFLDGPAAVAQTATPQSTPPQDPPREEPARRPRRPPPPARDPNTPGYVKAKELPDGASPRLRRTGTSSSALPTTRAPEMSVKEGVPQGQVFEFTMESKDSKIYPGIAREPNTSPAGPGRSQQTDRQQPPAPYTRRVAVYVPKQYVPGTEAPFIVGADGPDRTLFTALDNLIAEKRVPVMIAISIGNGGGDAQGSQRGLEYDTMSGKYAEFVETEVLPLVEKQYNVKLTKDPEGRATMGCSSGGAAACRWRGIARISTTGSELLRHVRLSAMAVQPRDSPWRVGLP